MTHVAILGPTSLLGKELREALEPRRHLWDRLTLLAGSAEEEGTVTESAGTAMLVGAATPEALADVDLVFACGELDHDLPVVHRRLQDGAGGATAIVLSPEARSEHGAPVVPGVDPEPVRSGHVLLSPHPAAVALSYLLAPLTRDEAGFSVEGASATTILPASMRGGQGLDDLLDQTREILAMSGERRETVFERQLAFSLYPAPEGASGIAELTRRVCGTDLPLAVETLQGAIFHGLSCSLFVRFRSDPGQDALREALAGQRHVRLSPTDAAVGEMPAPIDAAAQEEVLVGSVRPDPEHPGGYWIWAVVDNLVRGGALNAVEVAERLAAPEAISGDGRRPKAG